MRPLARSTDPKTSHDAAGSVKHALPRLQRLVLAALRDAADGMTLDELMAATGLEKVTVSPRLRPLAEMGFVADTGLTRTGKAGREQIVWQITSLGVNNVT